MKLTAVHKKIFRGQLCPYCRKPPTLMLNSSAIYSGVNHGPLWICHGCQAWVGCHPNSKAHRPMGRLATAELRAMKIQAHRAFDRVWKGGRMQRSAAYQWLSDQLGTPRTFTHIGMFSIDTCRRVITICKQKGKNGNVSL